MNLYLANLKHQNDCSRRDIGYPAEKCVLTLVPGATGGGMAGFAALGLLRRRGYRLIVAVSAAALAVYGRENLSSLTEQKDVLTGVCQPELAQQAAFVYLPVISANLVGKLAHGIYDEPLATLVFHALMAGKEVVGVLDGANPAGEDFLRRGFSAPPAGLVKLLNANLAKVADQNIRLYPAVKIEGVLAELTGGQEETAAPSGQTVYWDRSKRVITQADLQGLGQAVVIIPAGTRLTDVAREYAIARKIDIQMEKNR